MKTYYVYIMTNRSKTVLYVGMTNDIKLRPLEHKQGRYHRSFTDRYNCDKAGLFRRVFNEYRRRKAGAIHQTTLFTEDERRSDQLYKPRMERFE